MEDMGVSTTGKGVAVASTAVDGGGGCQFQSHLRTPSWCNKPAWLVSSLAGILPLILLFVPF